MRPVVVDGKRYESQTHAACHLGVDRSSVSRAIKTGVPVRGKLVRYADERRVTCPRCGGRGTVEVGS